MNVQLNIQCTASPPRLPLADRRDEPERHPRVVRAERLGERRRPVLTLRPRGEDGETPVNSRNPEHFAASPGKAASVLPGESLNCVGMAPAQG